MSLALRLAGKGKATVSPNPAVGAVLVKNGRVIGRGYHEKAGLAHAEVNAVKYAKSRGANCAGATLYVTLEPCSSHGRTPPCTDIIKREQIARVVIGCLDPDARHQGRGVEILRRAGISVDAGCLEKECREINLPFFNDKLRGRPWFIGKIALTKDGKINGQPRKWITASASRRHAHGLRYLADAILVGAGTVLADNPSLTLRHGFEGKGKEQPWRVILDSSGRVPRTSKLLTDEYQKRTLHLTAGKLHGKTKHRRQTPAQIARVLYERGIRSCLIEGGAGVLESFFQAGLIDEFYLYESTRVTSESPGALDGSKLRRCLKAGKFVKKESVRKAGDRITRYLSSSSAAFLSRISISRRRRADVVPKRK